MVTVWSGRANSVAAAGAGIAFCRQHCCRHRSWRWRRLCRRNCRFSSLSSMMAGETVLSSRATRSAIQSVSVVYACGICSLTSNTGTPARPAVPVSMLVASLDSCVLLTSTLMPCDSISDWNSCRSPGQVRRPRPRIGRTPWECRPGSHVRHQVVRHGLRRTVRAFLWLAANSPIDFSMAFSSFCHALRRDWNAFFLAGSAWKMPPSVRSPCRCGRPWRTIGGGCRLP